MASRTIQNERDEINRYAMKTADHCFDCRCIVWVGAWDLHDKCRFVGIVAIETSGIILKKTKMFAGDPAPFVMELPAYS